MCRPNEQQLFTKADRTINDILTMSSNSSQAPPRRQLPEHTPTRIESGEPRPRANMDLSIALLSVFRERLHPLLSTPAGYLDALPDFPCPHPLAPAPRNR
jgi:hypothetical protein